jgi:hypothetical protein
MALSTPHRKMTIIVYKEGTAASFHICPSSSFTAPHSTLQLCRHSRQMNHQISISNVSRIVKYPSGHVNRASPNFTLRCDCTVEGTDTVTICSPALWVWRRNMSWRNFPVLIFPLLSLRNRLKIEVGQLLSTFILGANSRSKSSVRYAGTTVQ